MNTLALIPTSGRYDAAVAAVHDGDTFTAGLLAAEVVRIDGMNAPELNTPAGKAAQVALAGLLANQIVTLTLHGREKYGRLLADVATPAVPNVAAWMIANGFAAPWDGHGPRPVPHAKPEPKAEPKELPMGLCRRNIRYPRGASAPWSMPSLCRAYGFPTGVVGPDQVIGIVELGGGYKPSDIAAAFKEWGLPAPHVTDVSVDGGSNSPGGDADGEVVLDIEVAGAAYSYCTGKAATIRVYFAPNTDAGFMHAVSKAAADGCATISISWGAPEDSWGKATCLSFDSACAAAVAQGAVIFAASGDSGSDDGESGLHVDFPAASPHVVGVGGTRKTPTSETVWGDGTSGTGGGYSVYFARPAWQTQSNAGRMVPDVAALADPATGYSIYLDGGWTTIGGTSAAAPLWAGLVAAVGVAAANTGRPKLGDLHSWLWSHPDVFADITSGSNGGFKATAGPDPCTGMGAPVGASILNAVLATIGGPPGKPPPPVKPPDPPVKPPEPVMTLNGYLQTPFGKWAIALSDGHPPAVPVYVNDKLAIPPEVLALLKKYFAVVWPVLLSDLPAVLIFKTKKWKDVLNDVVAAVLAAGGSLAV